GARQRLALLADRNGRVVDPALLGEHRRGLGVVHDGDRRPHHGADGGERLPPRSTPSFAPLGCPALHQHRPLGTAGARRPFRRIGAAGPLRGGRPRGTASLPRGRILTAGQAAGVRRTSGMTRVVFFWYSP